jgi:hypothetical protein
MGETVEVTARLGSTAKGRLEILQEVYAPLLVGSDVSRLEKLPSDLDQVRVRGMASH